MRTLLPVLCTALSLLVLAGCDGTDLASDVDAPSPFLHVEAQSAARSANADEYASSVVSATQGQAVPSGTIAADRSDPTQALGTPDARFFSLGLDVLSTPAQEGELIVAFGTGQQFQGLTLTVFEETYGRYVEERADVYVSGSPNGPWMYIGTASNQGSTSTTRPIDFDVRNLCVQYVRLVDQTNRGLFSSRRVGDGFDVNAVRISGTSACVPPRTIRGTVYADADGDAALDTTESGLADVLVRLTSSSGSFEAVTDSTGAFAAIVPGGTYVVSVPMSAPGRFNGLLFDTHTYSGVGSAEQTVAPADTGAVLFGFELDVDSVIDDLKNGRVEVFTLTSTFWAEQATKACTGDPSGAVSAADLNAYLADIEGLLLPIPFKFNLYAPACMARDILVPRLKGEESEFLRELLTAELNVVSKSGAKSDAFNLALLAFAEAIAVEQVYTPAGLSKHAGRAASLEETTTLLRTFNSSGGGGGVGGAR